MAETYFIVPASQHNQLVERAYRQRGYLPEEAAAGARFCELAATHGIRTHNAIKAIHLDELFGSKVGGCTPGAQLEKLPTRFKAVQRWDAHKKLGQSVAFAAMDACMQMADEFGVGIVTVDNATADVMTAREDGGTIAVTGTVTEKDGLAHVQATTQQLVK